MLFSVLTRKGSLKAQLSPCNVPVLVKGKQISASSSFSARFPHSGQPSSLTETPPAKMGPSFWAGGSASREMGRVGRWPQITGNTVRKGAWLHGSRLSRLLLHCGLLTLPIPPKLRMRT